MAISFYSFVMDKLEPELASYGINTYPKSESVLHARFWRSICAARTTAGNRHSGHKMPCAADWCFLDQLEIVPLCMIMPAV